MKQIIYKYDFNLNEHSYGDDGFVWKINIQKPNRLLKFAFQYDVLVCWFKLDIDSIINETRTFHLFMTGRTFNDYYNYIDTVMIHDYSFVLHIFEE